MSVFDNVSTKTIGIISLPIEVGPFILDTHIHVMSRPLNCNIILGKTCSPLFF